MLSVPHLFPLQKTIDRRLHDIQKTLYRKGNSCLSEETAQSGKMSLLVKYLAED